jgi:clan AA aspartic protease (TIGR02281 family)
LQATTRVATFARLQKIGLWGGLVKHLAAAAAIALCVAGCSRNVWVKPGATQADFNVDRYGCEKDARQSGYFGTGLVGALNMKGFYERCMVAQGWHLQRSSQTVDYSNAGARPIYSGVQSTPSQVYPLDRLVSCRIPGQSHPSFLMSSQCAAAGGAPNSTSTASDASTNTAGDTTTSTASDSGNPATATRLAVRMQKAGGTYAVPVLINNSISLNFIVDSGASDVSIPADVAMTLIRTGTLSDTDFIGHQTYVLADGSKMPSTTFRLRSLKVGDTVVENVKASVAPVQGSLLLGQSFLGRLKSWSVDNKKHALVFE